MIDFSKAREKMVEEQIIGRGIKDPRLIAAMKKVPRHLFVEEALQSQAYNDRPLPIGEKQTISQPYMVALMTEALELTGRERVLEIGSGSGYQTAILAELAQEVFSVERIRSLAIRARKLLYDLGYFNVEIKIFDGTFGWSEKGPFDAVIPVGNSDVQDLFRITKAETGMKKEDLGGCRFVKLIGRYGWEDEGTINNER
jgi:protein-L-isoaspartate(D-aspartate) O-methyltransferase